MNLKITLGIILPIVIILFLAFLSNLTIGFNVNKEITQTIPFNSLFTNSYAYDGNRNLISVETITVTNNFFLPRRYDTKQVIACLNSKSGTKTKMSLQVSYSDGSSSSQYSNSLNSYYGNSANNIEIGSNQNKQIKVFVEPYYYYGNLSQYNVYDELLLVEKNTDYYSYDSCINLNSKDLDNAVHINIIKNT